MKNFSILITGTDTGAGKTHFGCRLAAALDRLGYRVGVFKPVESGWTKRGAGSDTELLMRAAGNRQPISDICLYPLKAPLAPLLAAEAEGVTIDVEAVRGHFRKLSEIFDVLLVEGAGGLLAPLAPGLDALEIAVRDGIPVLVVVGNKLGCVNHALLTDRVLKAAGVRCLGFVMNDRPDFLDSSSGSNARLLQSMTETRVYTADDFSAEKLPSILRGWNTGNA